MSGTRIGLIVPSSNTTVEPDFARRLPPRTTVHTARMYLDATTPAAEQEMLDHHAPRAAVDLGTARCHVVAFACTSAGALIGLDGEAQLVERLSEKAGCPVVSTNEAVSRRLHQLGAARVAVVTPYIDELNAKIKGTLEERGIDVAEIHGMGMTENFAIAEVSTDQIVEFAVRSVRDQRIDALFVSCTNLRAVAAQEDLSTAFGVPVVTSNSATIDAVLAAADLPAS